MRQIVLIPWLLAVLSTLLGPAPAAPTLSTQPVAQPCGCEPHVTVTNNGCGCVFQFFVTGEAGTCTDTPACAQVNGCRMSGTMRWKCGMQLTVAEPFDVRTNCGGQVSVVSNCPAAGGGSGTGEIKLDCEECLPK